MTRRPTGPRAAAFLASLSINAALLLGLRQVGNLPGGDASDDGEAAPLLVIALDAGEAPPRSRRERRAKAPSAAARRHTVPSSATASTPVLAPGADQARATPLPVVVADDGWDLPGDGGTHEGAREGGFRSTFQHAMDDDAPPLARRTVLANLAFHDHGLGGFLARLSKMTDCGELQAALAHHPGSARTILQTMERLDCRP